jgi:hypothetical protein
MNATTQDNRNKLVIMDEMSDRKTYHPHLVLRKL